MRKLILKKVPNCYVLYFRRCTDIDWWREHNLETRITFTKDGKMNELAGEFQGLVEDARKAVTEKLKEEGYIFKRRYPNENRVVNTHERDGTPVEYLPAKQWFIKLFNTKKSF